MKVKEEKQDGGKAECEVLQAEVQKGKDCLEEAKQQLRLAGEPAHPPPPSPPSPPPTASPPRGPEQALLPTAPSTPSHPASHSCHHCPLEVLPSALHSPPLSQLAKAAAELTAPLFPQPPQMEVPSRPGHPEDRAASAPVQHIALCLLSPSHQLTSPLPMLWGCCCFRYQGSNAQPHACRAGACAAELYPSPSACF